MKQTPFGTVRATSEGVEYLTATAEETQRWANRPGYLWPCSTIEGHSIVALFWTNGDLVDLIVDDGSTDVDVSSHELSAWAQDLREYEPKDNQ